jgi:GTP-binding protein EngB required for normal cell division
MSARCTLKETWPLHTRQHADNLPTGQTGLGKSTLINTIFASNLVKSKGRLSPTEPIRQTSEIQAVTHVVEENGVRLRLNIVDTPGYGDLVNNDRCWDPIVKYIKDQHSAYLRKELTAQRERYVLSGSRNHTTISNITLATSRTPASTAASTSSHRPVTVSSQSTLSSLRS